MEIIATVASASKMKRVWSRTYYERMARRKMNSKCAYKRENRYCFRVAVMVEFFASEVVRFFFIKISMSAWFGQPVHKQLDGGGR